MVQTDVLQNILKDSNYRLSLFREEEIDALRERISTKTARGRESYSVKCIVREKNVQLNPEEVVRQLYVARLLQQYGYPKNRLAVEYSVNFGRERKRADIVILDKDRPDTAYTIVELKKPKLSDGKSQLRSYCNATGAPIGVWTNGQQISHYHRKDPNYFEEISDIPGHNQTLAEVLNECFTLRELILKDKIYAERKSLKELIKEMEDEVLANAGVDVFEEVFKLIFTKLYDEFLSRSDKDFINGYMKQTTKTGVAETRALYHNGRDYDSYIKAVEAVSNEGFRVMVFRNTGQTDAELKSKVQTLFRQAMEQWPGVFTPNATFELSDSHLAVCVSSLQDVKLFNSNLQVVDEAFEYLVNKSSKGEKGQYFTPRHVIDMCVQMLNPHRGEYMIDTASGSCGFPVHTIFQLTGQLFTNAGITEQDKQDALRVFGIDFDEKTVRVARTLNLIAGDGETNVLHLNTLDYERWDDKVEKDRYWIRTYSRGFERMEALRAEPGQNQRFNFDILMANPPFAGDIKESRIVHQYQLGFESNNPLGVKGSKARRSVGRDVLFIERNLDFLKPGGRMAIVLPQGRFNNVSDKYIREFIGQQARILAVVGLHQNTFKPHSGTKTSVLFLQKWNDNSELGPLCPWVEDYPIFMAVSEKGGKDNSGEYSYLKGEDGQYLLDWYGHLVVNHDLHSHDGALPPGIAETFIEWAGQQGLSFWPAAEAAEAARRQAWQGFLRECRRKPIYLDPDIDIDDVIKEMYDIPEITGQ